MPLNHPPLKLVFLSSGEGQLFETTAKYLKLKGFEILGLLTQNPEAGCVSRAERMNLPVTKLDKAALEASLSDSLRSLRPDYIILAGFTRKIPEETVRLYQNRIFNSHPSLLPKYGGKGMYGKFVHEAVVAAQEKVTGISVHVVTDGYDEGPVIASKQIEVLPQETALELEARLKTIEREFFGEALFTFLSNPLNVSPFPYEKKPSSSKI